MPEHAHESRCVHTGWVGTPKVDEAFHIGRRDCWSLGIEAVKDMVLEEAR
jgi:hypothetical protein